MSGDTEIGIGEVARRVGVRTSAVRYYETRGLIEPERRKGGKRVYGQEAVERMALITFATPGRRGIRTRPARTASS